VAVVSITVTLRPPFHGNKLHHLVDFLLRLIPFVCVECYGIISNLSKATGLADMISTMRLDIDHADEYDRNTTALAFSVVASALGITSLLPFLKVVCRSKKSWQAHHTGIRIVQQIAIMCSPATLAESCKLQRRMALDRRNYHQAVETKVELVQKAGVSEIVGKIVNELKDEAEPCRKMVIEPITKVVAALGASDIDEWL
jgi:hypothetical protein